MGSGINYKINEFICNPKNVKKRRNTRLEKCYGHVNIATAFKKKLALIIFLNCALVAISNSCGHRKHVFTGSGGGEKIH